MPVLSEKSYRKSLLMILPDFFFITRTCYGTYHTIQKIHSINRTAFKYCWKKIRTINDLKKKTKQIIFISIFLPRFPTSRTLEALSLDFSWVLSFSGICWNATGKIMHGGLRWSSSLALFAFALQLLFCRRSWICTTCQAFVRIMDEVGMRRGQCKWLRL